MADGSSSSATPWLAFLAGGLVVIVALIGFMVYSGQGPSTTKQVDVSIKPPAVSAPAAPTGAPAEG